MRFHTTIQHSKALDNYRVAFAAFEAVPDDDSYEGNPAYDVASAAQMEATSAYLDRPSLTPMEMHQKLTIIGERDVQHWSTEWPTVLAGIQRDLINMARPNVSPEIAEAFAAWAEQHALFYALRHDDEEELRRRCEATAAARDRLNELPCTTPGDFIAKAYVDLVVECGVDTDAGPFLVNTVGAHPNDQRIYRDISDSDLGRCMMALGRTDFDAATWVAEARRCGKNVTVVNDGDHRGLMLGMFREDRGGTIGDMLQCLTAGGLGEEANDRVSAIIAEIEANHPDLVATRTRPPLDEKGRPLGHPALAAAVEQTLDVTSA